MIAIRFAIADPGKTEERQRFIEDHKAYLRSAPVRILHSGPCFDAAGANQAAVVVAEVGSLAEFEAFSAADPFVASGVYASAQLLEWRPSIGSMSQA